MLTSVNHQFYVILYKEKNMINIIGGSGFVGSRLIKQLGVENCTNLDKVQSPDYSDITIICDIRKIEEIKFDNDGCVVLLAAEHRDDVVPKSLYYDVNVQGTINVLKQMDLMGMKNLIFTSSVAVYGLNKTNPDENHAVDPFNDYGKSKWQAELAIKKWYENDPKNKSVTILRPTVIFGERNRGNVYNLLSQISSGKFMMIGTGKNKKSMAYVANIVAFINFRLELSEPGYHIFNYADKQDLSMIELTQLIEKKTEIKIRKEKIPYWIGMLVGYGFNIVSLISGKKLSISSVRIKKFCATTQFDSSKVHNVFNAPYSLGDGLDRTLDYEFINKNSVDTLFYSE